MVNITKALLEAVPVAGSGLGFLFNEFFRPPVEVRQREWLAELASDIDRLQGQLNGPSLAELAGRPEFVTAIIQATTLAVRTHRKEKTVALRAGLMNIALSNQDDVRAPLFLSWIDDFTPEHLHLLGEVAAEHSRLAPHGRQSDGESGLLVSRILEGGTPDSPGGVKRQLLRDLENRGLVRVLYHQRSTDFFGVLLTALGEHFVAFITSPLTIE